MVEGFINHYNNVRLHSAIGYIAPVDKLNGRDQEIFKERDRKLEKARELRKKKRLRAYGSVDPREDNTAPCTPLRQTAGMSISN
jgi:putative transposase